MIYQSEIRFLESDLSELWGVDARGCHFGQKWHENMLLYLIQIKPVSHETWAVDSLDSLHFLPTKIRILAYLVVEHFAVAHRECRSGSARFDVESPISHSNVIGFKRLLHRWMRIVI